MKTYERRAAGIAVTFKLDVWDARIGAWRPRKGWKDYASEAEARAAVAGKVDFLVCNFGGGLGDHHSAPPRMRGSVGVRVARPSPAWGAGTSLAMLPTRLG